MVSESIKFIHFGPDSNTKPIWKLEKEINGQPSVFVHSGLLYYFVRSYCPDAFTYLWSVVGSIWEQPLTKPTPVLLNSSVNYQQVSYHLGVTLDEVWTHPYVKFLDDLNPHKYLDAMLKFAVDHTGSLEHLSVEAQSEKCLYLLSEPDDGERD
jgi:hypothetical protein